MAITLLTKRTATAGKAPAAADLQVGELAVNVADAKLYTKKSDGTVALLNVTQSLTLNVVSLDMGSYPVTSKSFLVSVPGVKLGDDVLVSVSGDQANGSMIDELEFEPLIAFGHAFGADQVQFTIACVNLFGVTSGIKYINFTVG